MRYSIRMRAAQGGAHENGGKHISGAERLLSEQELEEMAKALVHRALTHSKGKADFIRITIDQIAENKIAYVPCLDIESFEATDIDEGRNHAIEFLNHAGISKVAVETSMNYLLGLSTNMRGAILVDAKTGERLDKTGMRGIRVSKMDFETPDSALAILNRQGLTNVHIHEALVLASKVLSAPQVVGELCWSDDPDYIVGYVSAQGVYHRITKMKPMHSEQGGRVFFIDTTPSDTDIKRIIEYLQEQVVLVENPRRY